jgi:hypothetical protein
MQMSLLFEPRYVPELRRWRFEPATHRSFIRFKANAWEFNRGECVGNVRDLVGKLGANVCWACGLCVDPGDHHVGNDPIGDRAPHKQQSDILRQMRMRILDCDFTSHSFFVFGDSKAADFGSAAWTPTIAARGFAGNQVLKRLLSDSLQNVHNECNSWRQRGVIVRAMVRAALMTLRRHLLQWPASNLLITRFIEG